MKYQLKHVRLDKLNIPYETLRRDSFAGPDEQLKESLNLLGVFVPLVVKLLGKGEYEVWDGTRRVRLLKELGKPGSTLIPAHVVEGNDADAIVAQMNINQVRERLSQFAELEGLLLQATRATQRQAAPFACNKPKSNPKKPGRPKGHALAQRDAPAPAQINETILSFARSVPVVWWYAHRSERRMSRW